MTLSYETLQHRDVSQDRVVQDTDNSLLAYALSDEQLKAEINRRELLKVNKENALLIKELEEKERKIKQIEEERDNAKKEALIHKSNLECITSLMLKIVAQSNSSDKDKADVCHLIASYFNGEASIPSKQKTSRVFKYTEQTFRVRIDDDAVRNKTLSKACHDCKRYGLISQETNDKDFIDIFSGENTKAKIKWMEGPGSLAYFIKGLKKKSIIAIPKGHGVWNVTKSHFTDSYGKDIESDLASQQPPQINEMLLNLNDIISVLELGY